MVSGNVFDHVSSADGCVTKNSYKFIESKRCVITSTFRVALNG